MIGLEDYVAVAKDLDSGLEGMAIIAQDSEIMNIEHPLYEEFDLKSQLITNTERPEFLMQLGAYMQRGGWTETAEVIINIAASYCKDKDFEILYSAGEYFHNIKEDTQQSHEHFLASANSALNIVDSDSFPSEIIRNAMEKLKIVAGLVPERGEQGVIVQGLVKSKRWRELREVIIYLHSESLLGTSAVLAWARYVKDIGKGKELLDLISSGWVESNQLSGDDEWMLVMKNAKEYVQSFVLGGAKKGGASAEL
jgi:hypothetical protein